MSASKSLTEAHLRAERQVHVQLGNQLSFESHHRPNTVRQLEHNQPTGAVVRSPTGRLLLTRVLGEELGKDLAVCADSGLRAVVRERNPRIV